MTTMHGMCDPWFDALRDEFAARLDSGEELGASICVMLDGEPVVDLWADTSTQTAPNRGDGTRSSTSSPSPRR